MTVAVVAADDLLDDTWRAYVTTYVQEDGRVVDFGADARSTSEGQAYAMARAVIVEDEATFRRVRSWTLGNLQGGDPNALPAWLWGRRSDDSWGVLDANPASDADQWMAWALLRAAQAFGEPELREQAVALLGAIWAKETFELPQGRVVLPGPWAALDPVVQLNPSYWLTFAWREFAAADPRHPWTELLDPAYTLLDTCRAGGALVPDWCHVRAEDGEIRAAPRGKEAHDDFGFEALRVPWNVAADVAWYGDRRARRALRAYRPLVARWRDEGTLPGVIAPDGRARVDWPYLGQLGALLPAFGLLKPGVADAVWTRALAPARAPHGWGDRDDYYGQNWVWFGYALWTGRLAGPS